MSPPRWICRVRVYRCVRRRLERFVAITLPDLGPVRRAAKSLDRDLRRVEERLSRLELRLRHPGFRPDMTVAEAFERHPGVAAVFARRHLHRCHACPVAHDETLEELADGRGFSLDALLAELQLLSTGLSGSSDSS